MRSNLAIVPQDDAAEAFEEAVQAVVPKYKCEMQQQRPQQTDLQLQQQLFSMQRQQ